jgi:hypothetical protein
MMAIHYFRLTWLRKVCRSIFSASVCHDSGNVTGHVRLEDALQETLDAGERQQRL